MSRRFATVVLAVTFAAFGVFLVWPVAQIVRGGFVDGEGHITLRYVAALLRDPVYRGGILHSLGLATATTGLSLLLAVPLAWLADRFTFPAKTLLGALVLVPMILPPFVGAIGIKQMFGQTGAVNALLQRLHLLAPSAAIDWLSLHQFWGVAVVQALALYPIIYLNASAALGNLDPAMDEAAQNLGAGRWRRWWRVTLPLIRPGLFAGSTIVFIWAFTELGTPLVFDYNQVASVQVYEGLKDIGGNPVPYALVAVTLVVSLLMYVVGRSIFGRQIAVTAGKATQAARVKSLGGWRGWLCAAAFGFVGGLSLLPHAGVVLVAFARDWYATVLPSAWTTDNFALALGHPLTVPAIANSLKYSAASTLIDLVAGIAIAYVVVRSRFRARHLLDVVAMVPLAVPGLVLAFGYVAMAQDGKPFAFLNPTRNPTWLLIIAYSIRRLPYVVRSVAAGLEQTPVSLEEAAQNLGAVPAKSLIRITMPLVSANLIAGGLLAFAFAMLEVSDSLILAQKQAYYPITKAILELFQLLGDGRFLASALGVWAMAFLGLVILWLSVALGKRLGALFRL